MFGKNTKIRVAARNWLGQHYGARGWYMMVKSPAFWKEILGVRKWLFLTRFMPYTMVIYPDLSALYDMAIAVEKDEIPGAFVECGVWRGGCAALLAWFARQQGRQTHLFDSFEGLPEPIEKDGRRAIKRAQGRVGGHLKAIGLIAASIEEVRTLLFRICKFNEADLVLHKGWFQHVLPTIGATLGPIAILRLDADWYESTRVCLDNLYDHVSEGGFVVIDDYDHFEGCRLATDEFLRERGLTGVLRFEKCVYFRKPRAPKRLVDG